MKNVDKGWFLIRREHICGPLDGSGICIGLWTWLNSAANYQDTTIRFRGSPRILKRGSLITSVRELARQLSYTPNTIRKQLKYLVDWGQITLESTAVGTLITIVNYDRDQAFASLIPLVENTPDATAGDTPSDTRGGTPGNTQGDTQNGENTHEVTHQENRFENQKQTDNQELTTIHAVESDNNPHTLGTPSNEVTAVSALTAETPFLSSELTSRNGANGNGHSLEPELPEIALLWNKFAHPNLSRVRSMEPKSDRDKACRARWKEKPDQGYWIQVIQKMNESAFLTGMKKNSTFKASIKFLTRPERHVEILEGKYDSLNAKNGNGAHGPTPTESFDFTKPNGGGDESPLVSPTRLERMRRRIEDDKNPT